MAGSVFWATVKMDKASYGHDTLCLVLAWEGHVHSRLGYFPDNFRETVRQHVLCALRNMTDDLQDEVAHLEESITALQLRPADAHSA